MRASGLLCTALSVVLLSACMADEVDAQVGWVDPGSQGGVCDDARAWEQVQTPQTPWCSLNRAYQAAPDASRVLVRAGSYGKLELSGPRTGVVTIAAADGEIVDLAGASLAGVTGLRLEHMRFIDGVGIGKGARDVQILSAQFTNGGLDVRGGSSSIVLADSTIHTDSTGVNVAPDAAGEPVRDLVIRDNRFDGIGRDALQLKGFDGVLVEGNEITNVKRVDPSFHSDTIQTFEPGGSNLVIEGNYIHDNEAGILIKDATVNGVVIQNNVVTGSQGDAVALQVFSAPGVRIVNNTFWGRAMVLLRGDDLGLGAVVVNNVFEYFGFESRALLALEDYNLIGRGSRRGSHSFGGDPGFVSAAQRNFMPRPDSRLVDAATPTASPPLDFFRRSRSPRADIGAIEHFVETPQNAGAAPPPPPPAVVERSRSVCVVPFAQMQPRRLGVIRLGMTRVQIARSVPLPIFRTTRGLRFCVEGGGRVIIATPRKRARLILSTARGHELRGVRPGMRARRARRRFRDHRLSPNMLTHRTKRTISIAHVERGRVAWVAIADRKRVRTARRVETLLAKARKR